MFSHPSHTATLANSIIGVGILAMPFCFQKCGIILSVILLIVSNCITCVCCHYLIKCSLLTRRKSFELLGFQAFGSSGKLLVELCIIGYLLGTCITYYVVVGDLGPQIIMKMFDIEANDNSHIYRTLFMCAVTLFCILPLGMLKNVDSLSAVCTASVGFYICLAIKIVLESNEHILANDWQKRIVYWESGGILQCLPIFSMALSCQMQIFEVFGSINNQSLEKLNGIVKNAIWICTFVYIAVGFFGYVAFCTQEFSGNILVNLSASFSSDVIKIGFILSLAFSFPLVIFPCRASIYSLLYRREQQVDVSTYIPDSRFKAITFFIVIFSLCIALMIPSVELVIGLVGSTIGVAVCVIYPALCFRKIVKKDSTERNLAQFIILSGFCFMVLGTYANLNAIDEKSSGAHLEVQNQDNNNNPSILPTSIQAAMTVDADLKLTIENKPPDNDIPDKIIPPLPVDEKHEEEIADKQNSPDKLQVVSPAAEMKIVQIVQNQENHEVEIKLQPEAKKELPKNIIENLSNLTKVPQAHAINKDAFKKEEDIAAEENRALLADKLNDNKELKDTQNELKETKKLLNELKVEIDKKNMETQELVAEKLDAVVEKVEDIERKVQQQEENKKNSAVEEDKTNGGIAVKTQDIQRDFVKGTLLNILAEAAINREAEEAEAHKGVYEPKSYKSGVILEEQKKNLSEVKSRLPLPLARQIKSTNLRQNDKTVGNKSIKKKIKNITNILNSVKLPLIAKEEKYSETREQKNNKFTAEETNLEAIRRDILQIKNAENLIRSKRESQHVSNCLVEPNIETLCPDHLNDLKLSGLMRKLNSINEKDNN